MKLKIVFLCSALPFLVGCAALGESLSRSFTPGTPENEAVNEGVESAASGNILGVAIAGGTLLSLIGIRILKGKKNGKS